MIRGDSIHGRCSLRDDAVTVDLSLGDLAFSIRSTECTTELFYMLVRA